ncbi:MAG: PAS domain S-box protein [Burkholderiales bacterium PBB2]|nr:MAG: PAS domain S-box protein [Burkholderiales bacterium PBB2]
MSAPVDAAVLDGLFASDMPVGLAVLDRELRYRRVNRALADFNGVPAEQLLGRSVAEVLPEAYPHLAPLLHAVLHQGQAQEKFRIQVQVPSHPGELSEWEASYLPLRDAEQSVVGILVQAVNISSQRRAEEALRDSEAQLRRVLDGLFAFVGLLSLDGLLLEANRAPLEAAGIGKDAVLGRRFCDTYWWSHDTELQGWLQAAIADAGQGQVVRRDLVVRMRDDSRMTIDFMLAPLRDSQDRISHVIASGIDISDRVHSERALRASEARFRSAFNAAPDGMALVNASGRILLANSAMDRLFASPSGSLQDSDINTLVPLPARGGHTGLISQFFGHLQTRSMAKRRSLQALRRDGSLFNVEVGLNPIADSEPPEVLATVTDIDERLAAQAQIERALQEKTALLSEVHHRVKNNLQIISSLLRLQSRHVDESVKRVLRESKNRIRAMALTHQLLYERNDFTELELGPYLKRLAALLRESYSDPQQSIQVQVQAPDSGLSIHLQEAIPCGLIVNELVTNAFKHAFPDGRAGTIEIHAERDADGRLRVEVGDDGVGLAQRPDWKDSRTLGFQLVPLLAEQLDGQLSLLDGPGTRIRVCFASQQELPGDSSAGVATRPLSPATHALPRSINQVPPA